MPLIIHLGIVDIPYAQAPKKRRRKGGGKTPVETTGDVAEILENKYHVMEHFVELHTDDVIVPALEDAVQGSLEEILMAVARGGQTEVRAGIEVDSNTGTLSPVFASAEGKIDEAFRKMLDARELDGLGYTGIPTEAAKRGVNHRLKRPYKRRASRPSFIDTGLYQANFKSWID